MRHLRVLGMLLLAQALFAFTFTSGCSKKEKRAVDEDDEEVVAAKKGSEAKKGGTVAKGQREPLKAASLDGVIKGTVTYDGEPPKAEPIKSLLEHKNCKEFPVTENSDQTWIVNQANKGVANAVIFLVPPKGKYFELADEDKERKDEKIIDQPHCAFIPHVQVFYPTYFDGKATQKTGQKLKVMNSASFPHDTNFQGGAKNASGGQTISPGKFIYLDFVPEPQPVNIKCNFHTGMSAKVWVFDHPYFAVTDKDGKYEIKNVPTGVQVNVVVWHEGVSGQYFTPRTGEPKTFMSKENPLDYKIK